MLSKTMLKKIIATLTHVQVGHEPLPLTKTVLTDEREKALRDMNLAKEREDRERARWQQKHEENKEDTAEKVKPTEV